jgi:prephenate dehydrogenase
VQRATQVWSSIGAKVVTMTPEAHDKAFAAVSHLPHLLAFAFTNAITAQSEGTRFLELAGPGFRDFTRIAAGDPALWRDVLLANREQVLQQSQAFRTALSQLEALMSAGDSQALEQAISAASAARARWQPGAGVSPD